MKPLPAHATTLLLPLCLAACGVQDGAPDLPTSPTPIEEARDDTTALAALPGVYAQADLSSGRRIFRLCAACHTLTESGRHLVGPNLHGMFERGVGEVEGFNYSPALRSADFEWTPEQLDAWLADPRGFLPGNRMSFVGLNSETDRRDVIAWMLIETAR